MVRWRSAVLLAMLLLLPARSVSKSDEEEEDESENADEDSNDADGDDDEESDDTGMDKSDSDLGRRAPPIIATPKTISITRTTSRRPLECYVCGFKSDTPIKSCLDPSKYKVHTMTCHNSDDKCFTTVVSKGSSLEAVLRGCRSGCTNSPDNTCCEMNRCNSQAFAVPVVAPRALANKATKSIPTTVLFFVTILLVLQTVVKVAFV